jgi:diguanylate cyclase (GGDEF)-like protein
MLKIFRPQHTSRTYCRDALPEERRRQRMLEALIAQRTAQLHQALATVEKLSRLDPLTQVANRRQLEERLREEWARTVHRSIPLSVMMLDIDYFKQFNDSAGHLAGDDCLRELARALSANIRPHDFVARFGGEEFIVLLPATNGHAARVIAQRVQSCIRKLQLPHPGRTDGVSMVTASAGFATAESGYTGTPGDLIHQADMALYRAKEQGRDRVIFDRDIAAVS